MGRCAPEAGTGHAPHLTGPGPDEDGVDGVRALRLWIETLEDLRDINVIVTTGDIADDGSVEGCQRVYKMVGDLARQLDVPHVYTTGNHDRRASFFLRFRFGSPVFQRHRPGASGPGLR